MNAPRDLTPDHRDHDVLLIVSSATGDLGGSERDRATQLIAACHDCADLHREIQAIAQATAALPDAPRSREFTLTADDAVRLRRPSFRRFLVDLAGPNGIIGRPAATAVTSLGVVGILLASATGAFGQGVTLFGAAGPAITIDVGGTDQGEPRAASGAEASPDGADVTPTAAPGYQRPAGAEPPPSQDTALIDGGATRTPSGEAAGPSTPPTLGNSEGIKAGRDTAAATSLSPLVATSLALLVLGLGLFVLRRAAGRLS